MHLCSRSFARVYLKNPEYGVFVKCFSYMYNILHEIKFLASYSIDLFRLIFDDYAIHQSIRTLLSFGKPCDQFSVFKIKKKITIFWYWLGAYVLWEGKANICILLITRYNSGHPMMLISFELVFDFLVLFLFT